MWKNIRQNGQVCKWTGPDLNSAVRIFPTRRVNIYIYILEQQNMSQYIQISTNFIKSESWPKSEGHNK